MAARRREVSKAYFVGVRHSWQCLPHPEGTDEERERASREFAELSEEAMEQQLRREAERLQLHEILKPAIPDPKTGLRAITPEELAAFDTFLRNAMHRCGIKEILEEACGPPHVRIAALGQELGLDHHYCEISKEEREKRGIKTKEQREQYWLSVLRATVRQFPLLVICGADHVDSFGGLLRVSGYETETLVADYETTIF